MSDDERRDPPGGGQDRPDDRGDRPDERHGRHDPGHDASHEAALEPVDPDIDLQMPAQRAELAAGHLWPVLAVISAGGAVGAAARYGAVLLWPTPAGAFPWTVFWINLLGCALIGVLMVLVSEEGRSAHRLVRPFLGVGVLGGFTTFSTYASGFADLLTRDEAGRALAYAAGTLAGAMAAVWAAATVTRRLVHRTEAAR